METKNKKHLINFEDTKIQFSILGIGFAFVIFYIIMNMIYNNPFVATAQMPGGYAPSWWTTFNWIWIVAMLVLALTIWVLITHFKLTEKNYDAKTQAKYMGRYLPLQILASFLEAFGFQILIVGFGLAIFLDVFFQVFAFNSTWLYIFLILMSSCIIAYDLKFRENGIHINTITVLFMNMGFDTFSQINHALLYADTTGNLLYGFESLGMFNANILTVFGSSDTAYFAIVWMLIGILTATIGLALDIYLGNLVSLYECMSLTFCHAFYNDDREHGFVGAKTTQERFNFTVGFSLAIIMIALVHLCGWHQNNYPGDVTPGLFGFNAANYMVLFFAGTALYGIVYPVLLKVWMPLVYKINPLGERLLE